MASAVDMLALLRERGFVAQVAGEPELAARLGASPIVFYVGFDPTAPSLHVGSLVPLMAMAHMARAGHTPIAVLGSGTTMVGDPSGRTELRKMMTIDEIAANRGGIEPQIRRFLSDANERASVVDNGEWLRPLGYLDFLREIGSQFSVNRMLAAEAYKQRLEKGLSFLELNYQLLQAYDFLILRRRYGCVLQMGGDDQWGNILAGTDLIRRLDRVEAFGLTFPLLTTAAGQKMGKTAAGAVWLDGARTRPFDFFQYFVNVDDRDVAKLLALLTFLPMDEVRRLGALAGAELREAKAALAFEATAIVHGRDTAETERRAARAAFEEGGTDASIPTYTLARGAKMVDVLVASGLSVSKSAARRLIEQGGVRLGGRRIADVEDVVAAADLMAGGVLLHAGKKHVRRLVEG